MHLDDIKAPGQIKQLSYRQLNDLAGEIRQRIIEADLVDCIISLPAQLFLTTGIPACLWFLTRDKTGKNLKNGGRDRIGETLFVDARGETVFTQQVERDGRDERREHEIEKTWVDARTDGDFRLRYAEAIAGLRHRGRVTVEFKRDAAQAWQVEVLRVVRPELLR
jgi:type I restriction-modification system DNA methylase subunit